MHFSSFQYKKGAVNMIFINYVIMFNSAIVNPWDLSSLKLLSVKLCIYKVLKY